ncbi:hypothetical protein [Microbulbifer mangrovi]|uniref:hypothetical protein n=1 Tax=Microbulbifer mangrovi TaxID=927787 RepID=UPI0013013202|nr:hypothetical protein [Microbulbifer mangrovi]
MLEREASVGRYFLAPAYSSRETERDNSPSASGKKSVASGFSTCFYPHAFAHIAYLVEPPGFPGVIENIHRKRQLSATAQSATAETSAFYYRSAASSSSLGTNIPLWHQCTQQHIDMYYDFRRRK